MAAQPALSTNRTGQPRRGARGTVEFVNVMHHKPLMMHDWSPAVVFWMQRLGARVGDARLGAFHDAVLELGSVPLPIVTARGRPLNH